MIDKLEQKLNRFSEFISKSKNEKLIDFWNEIVNDLNDNLYSEFSVAENDITEFELYKLYENISKLQAYIFMIHRAKVNNKTKFITQYDPFQIFIKSPLYYKFVEEATKYEFKNDSLFIPINRKHKKFNTIKIKGGRI